LSNNYVNIRNFESLLAERTGKMGANVIREILKVVSQPGIEGKSLAPWETPDIVALIEDHQHQDSPHAGDRAQQVKGGVNHAGVQLFRYTIRVCSGSD
jgi:hypothetical protein